MKDHAFTILNDIGSIAASAAALMSIQFAVLIAGLVVADCFLRRRLRATLRCGLWMLLILKLLVPPGLTLPTSIAYWVGPRLLNPSIQLDSPKARITIRAADSSAAFKPTTALPPPAPLRPSLGFEAWLVLGWTAGVCAMAALMIRRHRLVKRLLKESQPAPPNLTAAFRDVAAELGMLKLPDLRISPVEHSPAVCGLWRPSILIPSKLVGRLSSESWRSVFGHELLHIRRHDLWSNLVQIIAQIVWWWNPLVWFANHRIRTLRESAVDEEMMIALDHGDLTYPEALVAVARQCSSQPLQALSLLGILESPKRLEIRIRRLLEEPLPRTARLGWSGWLVVAITALSLLPMGFSRRVEARVFAHGNETKTAESSAKVLEGIESKAQAQSAPTSQSAQTTSAIPQVTTLHTRTFKVDPGTLLKALEESSGEVNMKSLPLEQLQSRLKVYFEKLGVSSFSSSTPTEPQDQSRPSLFFNDRSGIVFLRATKADHEIVELALQRLNPSPPQMVLEVKWLEASPEVIAAQAIPWRTNATSAPVQTPNAALQSAPVAILTASQAQSLIATLEKTAGVDLLSAPRVTTLAGRHAQISVTDEKSIIVAQTNRGSGIEFTSIKLATGPTIDLEPTMDSRASNVIHVRAKARIVEFLGYVQASSPSPLIRTNTTEGNGLVWDGQTLALGFGTVTNSLRWSSKVRVLGDIPWVGRLFRSEGTNSVRRQQIVLITPTLIDPAGNRINSPENLPFDPSTIPAGRF